MTIIRVEINEDDEPCGQHDKYQLHPGALSDDKFDELCSIVEESKVLEHDELHYGPARGQHQILIAVETSNSVHELHACDVKLSGPQLALASFIMDEGQKIEREPVNGSEDNSEIE